VTERTFIRHVVLFTAKRAEDVPRIVEGLSLLADIPHSTRLEVVRNSGVDALSQGTDVVVYGEFADAEALAAYKAHPLYEESIARVRPLRDTRIAADF